MKRFLIAIAYDCDGFGNAEIINATSYGKALEIFNKKHECNYYYGSIIGEVDKNNNITISSKDLCFIINT